MGRTFLAGKHGLIVVTIMAALGIMVSSAFSNTVAARPDVFVQLGHSDDVRSMDFSPDGKLLVSMGNDKAVKVWDLESGREMTTLVPGGDMLTAFFSFEGKNVWTVEVGGVVRLWDIGTGRTTARIAAGKPVSAAAPSPDGKYLAVVAREKLEYWNLVTRKKSFEIGMKPGYGRGVSFSGDGLKAAVAYAGSEYPDPENTIHIYDLKRKSLTRIIKGGPSLFGSVAFSPDGRTIMAGSANGEKDAQVRVWDAAGGRLIVAFPYTYLPFSVGFSRNGRWAAAGSSAEARIYDTVTWEQKQVSEGHDPVAFSPDSRTLACSTSWESIHGIGSYVVGLRLVDAATGNLVKKMVRNAEWSTDALFSTSGEGLVVAGVRRSYWDLRNGKRAMTRILRDPQGQTAYTNAESPGETLAVQYTDQGLRLWDTVSGQLVHSFPKDGGSPLSTLRFSPTGKFLVTGMWDGSLSLWDMGKRVRLRSFSGKHASRVTALAFSPDEAFVYSAGDGDDRIIKKWNLSTGVLARSYDTPTSVTVLETSPDGNLLVAAGFTGNDNDIDVIDASSGRTLRSFKGHADIVQSLALSHDGKVVVSTDFDFRVKLWDLETATEIRSFYGHSGNIDAVSFSGDDLRLVTTSRDGTTRVWDVLKGKELVRLISFTDGEWIAITPEGYYNASDKADAYINVRMGRNVYGIENFRESFFRPDLVKVALAGGSLKEFMGIADVKQPPSVNFKDTPETVDADRVTVKLRIRDNGGGIGDIRLYLNGTAVSLDSRALKRVSPGPEDLVREYVIPLSAGENTLKAVAFNGENTMQGREAVIRVTSSLAEERAPALHALVIGIDDFVNPKLKLSYSAADARLFAETLKQAGESLFSSVNVKTLTERSQTTRETLIRELAAFRNLRPDDVFVFFIASHGTVDEGEYFLITSNVGPLRTERLKTDALTQGELKEAIANIPATKKLILIDTCNAGALGDAIQTAMLTRGMSEDTALKILSRSVGSTILSASTSVQEAIEGYNGHGLFTWVLTEGLKGKAAKSGTGFIKTTELADYVDSEVPILAEKVFKRAQYPTISISGQAFPIGKLGETPVPGDLTEP